MVDDPIERVFNERLEEVTYSLANAVTNISNEPGFVTRYDSTATNVQTTTTWFQCFDIELAAGQNSITLRTVDLAGNVTTRTYIIELNTQNDHQPPVVNLQWPSAGNTLAGSTFLLLGQVDDPTAKVTATLSVNGTATTYEGVVERTGQFWVEDLPLDGATSVSLNVQDFAGNPAGVIEFSISKSDLEIQIDPLASNDAYYQPTATVTGTISDNQYTLKINDADATIGAHNGTAYTWSAANVPVGTSGTATFQAVATPNGPGLPAVNQMFAVEKPAVLRLLAKELMKSRSSSWAPCQEVSEALSSSDYTLWASGIPGKRTYQLTTLQPVGQPCTAETHTTDEEITWPATEWPTLAPGQWRRRYDGGPWSSDFEGIEGHIADQGSIPGPDLRFETGSSKNTFSVGPSMAVTEHRSANTYLALYTGGKQIPHRRNLFSVLATASYFPPDPEGVTSWEGESSSIAFEYLKVLGQRVGMEGRVYFVLPDYQGYPIGVSVDPARQVDLYKYNLEATKHRLVIQANNVLLADDRVRPIAKFCVGQKINFTAEFNPEVPGIHRADYEWLMAGNWVNYIQSIWPSKQYLISWPLTWKQNTHAWWVRGNAHTPVASKWDLTMSNGQKISVSGKGLINMHRPALTGFAAINPPYAPTINLDQTSAVGRPYLQLGDETGGFMQFHWGIVSHFQGEADFTQLINQFRYRDEYFPLRGWFRNTDGKFALDGSEFYSGATVSVFAHTVAFVALGDGPGNPVGITTATASDEFKSYLRFRPSGADSIFVTLGRVDWSWYAEASNPSGYPYQNQPNYWSLIGSSVGGPTPSDDDEFPYWQSVVHSWFDE